MSDLLQSKLQGRKRGCDRKRCIWAVHNEVSLLRTRCSAALSVVLSLKPVPKSLTVPKEDGGEG